jgi:hypothetical protein
MLSSSEKFLEQNIPIPPPSHPKQYRAIGLMEGQYQRSQEHQTRGILITKEGSVIDTVVLGKVLSVFKKHIDLEQPHLWVVYPRTRLGNDELQLQIAGVWEPETLHPDTTPNLEPSLSQEEDKDSSKVVMKSGDFSIRGEVVYASHQKKIVIVKIRQSPKHSSEKPKFFKVKLWGNLPAKAVGCFWELEVKLIDNKLTIQTGANLGTLLKKKGILQKKRSGYQFPPQKPSPQSDRPSSAGKISERPILSPRRKVLPKPIKNTNSQPHRD